MKAHKPLLPLLFPLLLLVTGCNKPSPTEYIGIVSAMDIEINLLLKEASIKESKTVGGATFHVGTLCGKNVVISRSGIGKVRASSGFTCMLNNFDIFKVIFTGVAGGIKDEENVMDQVIATKIVEHDYGLQTNEGFTWCGGDPAFLEPGEYFHSDPALIDLAYESSLAVLKDHNVFKGLIATGDQFISSTEYVQWLDKEFDAYACEMEGAAIAKVCTIYDKPFVVMRTLSDKADGSAQDSYENFMDEAATQSSRIVLKMMESIS